jgi:predicted RNA binding protein YcfA (HicA-like mRNA interferase family)
MNERLPALRARDVIRALVRAGFAVSRTSGSHCRLIHTTDPARRVTVPLHGSTDLKRGTLRGIINQAGLTVAQFIALL